MSGSGRKTAVVTGSTDGMGRLVAKRLGAAGYSVIVHGRDAARGDAVVDAIRAKGGEARFFGADLASLADIRNLAARIEAETDRIDVLINNAGIGTGPEGAPRLTSADGFERRFAVNYLSTYYLTRLLLQKVRKSAPARIIIVASDGQEAIDFSDIMLERGYTGFSGYCRSKVAQIMFMIDLAGELAGSGVTVNAMHPGSFMDTTMVREMRHAVVDSVDEGADTLFGLATDAKFDGVSGRYFQRRLDARANEQVYDAQARATLKAVSEQLTGLAKS